MPDRRGASHPSFAPFAVACLGIATYAAMDALMKGLSIAIGAYSTLFWRLGIGVLLTAALYATSRPVRPSNHVIRVHAARSVVVTIMALAFFWGIARVPLAEAIALSFIAPLIALALAAVFLKERIGRRSLIASTLGIAGVAVILAGRVGGEHGPETMWGIAAVLVSAAFYAVNLVMARRQAQLAKPREIAFFQSVFVLAILALGVPVFVSVPAAEHWPALAAAAVLAVVSLLLLSWAYARAEAQILINVEYTAFVWAALLGWWVFDEAVTLATLAGTALIVTGCIIAARGAGGPASPEAEAAA
ncbi:MAG: DMT family transporter [Pseudomonadota bacterium]